MEAKLALFYFIFATFSIFVYPAPFTKYSEDFVNRLSFHPFYPEAKNLNGEQLQQLVKLIDKWDSKNESQRDKDNEFVSDMQENYPELFEIMLPIFLRDTKRMRSAGEEEQKFESFYSNQKYKVNLSTDNQITRFLIRVVPKWRKLSQHAKNEFQTSFPDIGQALNEASKMVEIAK